MSENIHFVVQKNVGLITLDRPKKLNALTFEMCAALDQQLIQWQEDANIRAVIIRGNGERAFCAGGDIASIYHNGPENIDASLEFFRTEYAMNARIFHFTKPYIALLHGISMGGGLGVSIHGSYRVADPNTIMAMPETGIGFFPDVGSSYFLSRIPGEFGVYLGLTGHRFSAHDAHFFGLVDYVIPQNKFDQLTDEIINAEKNIDDVLQSFSRPFQQSELLTQEKLINECFARDTIEAVFEQLQQQKNAFAQQTLETLKTKSPNSLRITLQELRDAKNLNFDECMAKETKIGGEILQHPDFYEGVRAAVIDKDGAPNWQL